MVEGLSPGVGFRLWKNDVPIARLPQTPRTWATPLVKGGVAAEVAATVPHLWRRTGKRWH